MCVCVSCVNKEAELSHTHTHVQRVVSTPCDYTRGLHTQLCSRCSQFSLHDTLFCATQIDTVIITVLWIIASPGRFSPHHFAAGILINFYNSWPLQPALCMVVL